MGSKKEKRFLWGALAIDVLTAVFVAASMIWLFLGPDGSLLAHNMTAFRYFTVDSNVLLGVVALTMIPLDVMVLKGKWEKLPRWAFLLLHTATMSTNITMLTVLFFLGPTMGYGSMYAHSLLFLHLLSPLAGLARYLFFSAKSETMVWHLSMLGAGPMILYGTIYVINVVAHDGYGDSNYDWYGFGSGGPGVAAFSSILMLVLSLGGSIGYYFARCGLIKALRLS